MYKLQNIKQFLNEGIEDRHSDLVDELEPLLAKVKNKKKLKIYQDEFNSILDDFDEAYDDDDNRQMKELIGELEDLLKTIKKSVNENLSSFINESMLNNQEVFEDSAGTIELLKPLTVRDQNGKPIKLPKGAQGRHKRIGWDSDFFVWQGQDIPMMWKGKEQFPESDVEIII